MCVMGALLDVLPRHGVCPLCAANGKGAGAGSGEREARDKDLEVGLGPVVGRCIGDEHAAVVLVIHPRWAEGNGCDGILRHAPGEVKSEGRAGGETAGRDF